MKRVDLIRHLERPISGEAGTGEEDVVGLPFPRRPARVHRRGLLASDPLASNPISTDAGKPSRTVSLPRGLSSAGSGNSLANQS